MGRAAAWFARRKAEALATQERPETAQDSQEAAPEPPPVVEVEPPPPPAQLAPQPAAKVSARKPVAIPTRNLATNSDCPTNWAQVPDLPPRGRRLKLPPGQRVNYKVDIQGLGWVLLSFTPWGTVTVYPGPTAAPVSFATLEEAAEWLGKAPRP